ncbi:MAG TPA: hypothetical protein VHB53_12305, partial [Solirubrobacterales bacterium]|nr:hypothetical protein [Solirubrobacterales bacterium]
MICPARRPLASLLRLLILAAAPACLVLALAAGTAVAASGPAPSLAIRLFSSPTRLAPGDETGEALYEVQVVNVGAAPTDGSPLTLTDELPEGVTVAPPSSVGAEELRLADDKFNRAPGASCEAVPQPHCTATSTLQPGESVTMWVPLHVSASAGGIAVNRASVSGGGAAPAAVTESTPFATGPLPFGFSALDTAITGGAGAPYAQAGGHPYLFRTYLSFNTLSKSSQENPPAGNPRDVLARLPRGMVVDPEATPVRCTEAEFESGSEGECPNASAIGLVRPIIGAFGYNEIGLAEPIYNMVPPHGSAASLAFNVAGLGLYVHLLGGVNSAGEYQLTASAKNVPQYGRFSGVTVELWGDPSDPSHDFRRGHCGFATGLGLQCPVASVSTPLLTMPSSCTSGPLRMSITADSWQEPEKFIEGSSVVENAVGEPLALEGCGGLEFSPSITSRPTTDHADSPTGLEFDLHQPQREDKEQLATANLKDARVTLPPGLTVNPSAANGLDACSAEQIGLTTAVGDAQPHFTEAPQGCPNGAKLGTLEVSTPLLEHKLAGAIYLASPYQNPFGSLLSIYLAIEDEETGIVAKLAGKVEPDPQTGQLTATFTENPELPIEDIDLHFFEGNGAALKTSLSCGTYTTNSDLTPWSAPEGADAHPSDSFTTDVAASGSGACPASESAAPDNPSFEAGTVAPIAGAFSPFVLRLARTDGSQQISGIDTTLPAGLTGKLAGIPYCPEGAIAQARSREAPNKGTTEKESPSCPPASEVGSVTVGAGAGAEPYYVAGHAYLAGPYKGAPLSLVIITPAVAGPFDLGTVVTRVALFVDPTTAQIHAVSDPLPTILQGIPLDIRSIALKLDRPSFTLNPTSCNPSAVTGSASSPAGAVAPLTNRFQVGGCDHLKFKPKLAVSLKGSTTRTGHPALKAVVTYPKQGAYANIARA